MIDYCIWLINNTNVDYIATCSNVIIDRDGYIGKYCACCGRKIVTPILIKKGIELCKLM